MRFFLCFRLKFSQYPRLNFLRCPKNRLIQWPWLKFCQSSMLCLFSRLRLRLIYFRFCLSICEMYSSEFCGWFTSIKSKLNFQDLWDAYSFEYPFLHSCYLEVGLIDYYTQVIVVYFPIGFSFDEEATLPVRCTLEWLKNFKLSGWSFEEWG
jgi:hypothetical protein